MFNNTNEKSIKGLTNKDVKKSLRNIGKNRVFKIPEDISVIKTNAFKTVNLLNEYKIDTLIISKNVKLVETNAFNKCTVNKIFFEGNFNEVIIQENAFEGCSADLVEFEVKKVILKESAFRESCIREVIFNSGSLSEIPKWCFEDSEIRKITIPNGCGKIKENAFANCDRLVEINMPISVKEIEKMVFFNCMYLKKISMWVKKVTDNCFWNCENLKEVNLYDTEIIEKEAFSNCESLEIVNLDKFDSSSLECNVSIGEEAFVECRNLKQIKCKNDVSIICVETNAFKSCSMLYEIDLSSAKEIQDGAFCEATSLKSINLSKIKIIGDSAFFACSSLVEVIFGNNLEYIGESAFSNCFNLEKVSIMSEIREIGNSAFYECKALRKFETDSKALKKISKQTFENCSRLEIVDFSNDSNIILIEEEAFSFCHCLREVSNLKSVKIEKEAFNGCSQLLKFNFEGVIEVGERAFFGCKDLSILNFSSKLRFIENEAFAQCFSLETVMLNNYISTGYDVFKDCIRLKKIEFNSNFNERNDEKRVELY